MTNKNRLALSAVILLFAHCYTVPSVAGQEIGFGEVVVKLELFSPGIAQGQRAASDLAALGDGSGRLAVANLDGFVRLLGGDGSTLDSPTQPFLDTNSPDSLYNSSFGFTGLAVHPDFGTPTAPGYGKLFTIATENFATSTADFPTPAPVSLPLGAHQDVIYEWTANDPTINNPTWTKREVARFDQPHREHNVADLAFDKDGFLYFGSGDGGFVGTNAERALRAQQLDNHHGTVMRIDPLSPGVTQMTNVSSSANGQYSVPNDNPFALDGDSNTLAEVFAYGVRSPYRINFDSLTDELYLGDVGENRREEVSLIESGKNYGWGYKEGSLTSFAGTPPDGLELVDPLFEYGREDGRTVVGGTVYRGSLIPELEGMYIWADFGFQANPFQTPTRLLYGDPLTGDMNELLIDPAGMQISELNGPADGSTVHWIFSISEAADGELYLTANPGGKVFRLSAATSDADFNSDGDVDGTDFLTWQQGFGVGSTATEGDATGDSSVSGIDLEVWELQFGLTEFGIGQSLAEAVPEPAGITLVASAIGIITLLRRSRVSK